MKQEVAQKSQVPPPHLSSAPSALSPALSPVQGCHPESGLDGVRLQQLPGEVPEATQVRTEEPMAITPSLHIYFPE